MAYRYYESSEGEENPSQATPVSSHRANNWNDDEDDYANCTQSEGYNSDDNLCTQQGVPPSAKRNEPCWHYNGLGCQDGDNCLYWHVCRFSWIGACRHGDNCHLRHIEDLDSDDSRGRRSDSERGRQGRRGRRRSPRRTIRTSGETSYSNDQLKNGEMWKWQLKDGQGWRDIANDHVIEAQFSKPYTGGITLHNTPWGAITIDFQQLQVRHRQDVQVRRLSSPKTVWLWYFKGEDGWSQYGEPDSQGRCSRVNSSTLEMEYQKNQQGSFQFKVTSYTYEIRFRDMHQQNVSSRCRREVRRRPSYPSTQNSVQANATLPQTQALARHISALSLPRYSTAPKWEFSGIGKRWHSYQHRVGSNFECSTDSVLIEAEYQKNPRGSMTFTVNGQSYVLDFAAMTQTNTSIGTVRKVRRV